MTDIHGATSVVVSTPKLVAAAEPAVSPSATRSTAPVFLDPTGRRRRWLVLGSLLLGLAGALVLVAVLAVLLSPAPTMRPSPVLGPSWVPATSVPVAGVRVGP